ncbi:MAG: hypothetical protein HKL90_05210 [Elusimicrobia bacterium]|nr:hypothetical protein [Elusimicrobiota bacterium]
MPRRPGTYEYEDEIPCRLCGRAFQAIGWSHLQSKHHFSGPTAVEDYKKRFGLSRASCRALERKRLRSYIEMLEAAGKHWTKERVVKLLRARHAAGRPLNHAASRDLAGAARKFFGTYNKALEAARLDPWKIELQHRWTKPRLIDALRARAVNGVWAPRASARGSCAALRLAAGKLFGSWPKALQVAGLIAPRAPRVAWTKEIVVRRIRRRARLGLGLSSKDAARSEPGLVAAAARVMGRPWSVVIQELGYRARKTVWTDEALRREILHLHRFGRSRLPGVSRNAVHIAARKRFGSWWKALRAVGVKPDRPPLQRWTKELALRRIRERASRGESLAWRDVLKSEKGLYRAASRFFGKPWVRLMRDLGHDGGASRVLRADAATARAMGAAA